MLRSLSLYLVSTWDLNTAIKRLTRKKKQRNYTYVYFFLSVFLSTRLQRGKEGEEIKNLFRGLPAPITRSAVSVSGPVLLLTTLTLLRANTALYHPEPAE